MTASLLTENESLGDIAGFSREALEEVIESIKRTLSDPATRKLSQRAVQGKVWHRSPKVAAILSNLRREEELVRSKIMSLISQLVYNFHEFAENATFARAGIFQDERIHSGSSLDHKEEFDLYCLDAKERLYIVLKNYEWLQDFFRLYPLHFYENSFQFVDRIPKKKLPVHVKVIGLGIGGSVALSGLLKNGVKAVGFEKRSESGPRSVSSRYQNASWRAYDIAAKLVDEEAFQHLVENQQRLNVKYDDGSEAIVTTDRVQVILGSAIQSAIDSARRYGAEVHFDCNSDDFFSEANPPEKSDIVALFCGAHTANLFPGLKEEMGLIEFGEELSSPCKMWLRLRESDKIEPFCSRGGENGAENWHYTIESARKDLRDIERIKNTLTSMYEWNKQKIQKGHDVGMSIDELESKYQNQMKKCNDLLETMKKGNDSKRFDYIFTNAPLNDHNMSKYEADKEDVALDGSYTVDIKIAKKASVTNESLLKKFNTNLIVTGGDACVPPNPQAAYGATLACEAAGSVVQLAVAVGHLNAILQDAEKFRDCIPPEWLQNLETLKELLTLYFDTRSRAENYFQFVQTLICNLYSLPAFYSDEDQL